MVTFDTRLLFDRVRQLGLPDDVFHRATGVHYDDIEETPDPESISLGFLDRAADILGLHPADLLNDAPPDAEHDIADILLLNAALTAGPLSEPELAALTGWSARRLQHTLGNLDLKLYFDGPQTITIADEKITILPTHNDDHPDGSADYGRWLAACTAPGAFDAVGVLRLLHVHVAAHRDPSCGTATAAEAERLTALRLARPAPSTSHDGRFVLSGYDTLIEPHPDLLFALGLTDRQPDTRTPRPGEQPVPLSSGEGGG